MEKYTNVSTGTSALSFLNILLEFLRFTDFTPNSNSNSNFLRWSLQGNPVLITGQSVIG